MPTTYYASADATLKEDFPTVNYGEGNSLFLGVDSSSNVLRSLFRFDISATVGAVLSATFRLNVYSIPVASEKPATLYRLTEGRWVEATTTWNTYDGANGWPGGVGGAGDTTEDGKVAFNLPASTGWLEVAGLTTICNDAIAGASGIVNLLIKRDTEVDDPVGNHYISARSREYDAGSVKPELVITSAGASGRPAHPQFMWDSK